MQRRCLPFPTSARIGALIGAAAVASTALAGCSTATPDPAPSPSAPSASATTQASAPTCDSIASQGAITTALAAGSTTAGSLTTAVQPSAALDTAVIRSQGGLACSWRIGEPATSYGAGAGDWGYLTVLVLPNASDAWTTPYGEDSPSDQTAMIGGVEATTVQTESGWLVSAPVGPNWVEVALAAGGLVTGEGRFTGSEYDATAGRVADVASEVFSALSSATPLASTSSLPAPNGPGACDGSLSPAPIAAAVGGDIESATAELLDTPVYSLADEAGVRAGEFSCRYTVDGIPNIQVTVLPTAAQLLPEMASAADFSTGFDRLELDGSTEEETAYGSRDDNAPASTLLFSIGQRLVQVNSFDKAEAVAGAIIAETR